MTISTYLVTYRYKDEDHTFTVRAASELSARVAARERVRATIISIQEVATDGIH